MNNDEADVLATLLRATLGRHDRRYQGRIAASAGVAAADLDRFLDGDWNAIPPERIAQMALAVHRVERALAAQYPPEPRHAPTPARHGRYVPFSPR